MRTYLRLFAKNERMWGPGYLPAAPRLSEALARSDAACAGLAAATLVFELAAVPLLALGPDARRPAAAAAFLAFHAGIALAASRAETSHQCVVFGP
jgi:hypothetical protein